MKNNQIFPTDCINPLNLISFINFSQKTRVTQKFLPANMLPYKHTVMSTKTTRERPYNNDKDKNKNQLQNTNIHESYLNKKQLSANQNGVDFAI